VTGKKGRHAVHTWLLFEEATWKVGGALRSDRMPVACRREANAKEAGLHGRLVGPRVKKETAALVGGRRRRFSAAAAAAGAEQSAIPWV